MGSFLSLDEDAGELEEKFGEFRKYVEEKLDFIETANNTLNSNEKKRKFCISLGESDFKDCDSNCNSF